MVSDLLHATVLPVFTLYFLPRYDMSESQKKKYIYIYIHIRIYVLKGIILPLLRMRTRGNYEATPIRPRPHLIHMVRSGCYFFVQLQEYCSGSECRSGIVAASSAKTQQPLTYKCYGKKVKQLVA